MLIVVAGAGVEPAISVVMSHEWYSVPLARDRMTVEVRPSVGTVINSPNVFYLILCHRRYMNVSNCIHWWVNKSGGLPFTIVDLTNSCSCVRRVYKEVSL